MATCYSKAFVSPSHKVRGSRHHLRSSILMWAVLALPFLGRQRLVMRLYGHLFREQLLPDPHRLRHLTVALRAGVALGTYPLPPAGCLPHRGVPEPFTCRRRAAWLSAPSTENRSFSGMVLVHCPSSLPLDEDRTRMSARVCTLPRSWCGSQS